MAVLTRRRNTRGPRGPHCSLCKSRANQVPALLSCLPSFVLSHPFDPRNPLQYIRSRQLPTVKPLLRRLPRKLSLRSSHYRKFSSVRLRHLCQLIHSPGLVLRHLAMCVLNLIHTVHLSDQSIQSVPAGSVQKHAQHHSNTKPCGYTFVSARARPLRSFVRLSHQTPHFLFSALPQFDSVDNDTPLHKLRLILQTPRPQRGSLDLESLIQDRPQIDRRNIASFEPVFF